MRTAIKPLQVPAELKDTISIASGVPTTTSLRIAERYGKEHKYVLGVIDEIINLGEDQDFINAHIMESRTLDKYRRALRIYTLTEEGYFIVAAGFTGPDAINLRVRFTRAFTTMKGLIESRVREEARLEGSNEGAAVERKISSSLVREQLRQYAEKVHDLRWELELKNGKVRALEEALIRGKIKVPKLSQPKRPIFVCEAARTIQEITKDIIDGDNNPFVSEKVISVSALKVLLLDKSSLVYIPTSDINTALTDLGYVSLGRVRVKGGDRHTIWALAKDPTPDEGKIISFKRRVEIMEDVESNLL